jgi:phytoene dehydrogenase-like protein
MPEAGRMKVRIHFRYGAELVLMPDAGTLFAQFGKSFDYYELIRLDPSYRIYWQMAHGYSCLRTKNFRKLEGGK